MSYRYRVRSQVLQDVSKRSLGTTVLGQFINYPICVAPSALQVYAHRDAEKATAKGAEEAGALMVLSSASSTRMEDVAAAAPNGLRWLQMYPFNDRKITLNFIKRAESLGFKALVVTVDSPVPGMDSRMTELNTEEPFASDHTTGFWNYDADIPSSRAAIAAGDWNYYKYMYQSQYNPTATFEYIKWIKHNTSLPVVCKGILTFESARRAADAEVDGILVSAHGGRQMDGAPAPIDALAEVVDAVRGRDVEVYMDGGVRTGTDVFKALGRGAKAVFVGRPILWGLACQGSEGVKNILQILRSQLDDTLAISGCTSPDAIPEGTVVHETFYHHYEPRSMRKKNKL